MSKTGILLLNIGTPAHPDTLSVFRYLKQFLSDPRVIDLPALWRWLLVHGLILPLRSRRSARAYQQIWTQAGSPLLINSQRLQAALAAQLGNAYQVEIGMRYGKPDIHTALKKLADCSQIKILPLFPQYSSAATGSALAEANLPQAVEQLYFYQHPGFIAAYLAVIKVQLANKSVDKLIFSYHGLPERHLIHNQFGEGECHAVCDKQQDCPSMSAANQWCYRAQCYATSHLLAAGLQLKPAQYTVAFQSRLGRTPWIKPYTDLLLPVLLQQGVKNIAVVCPSFVADCLETLEEVNIRLRASWRQLGGGEFYFIPCLNDHPAWVEALREMVVSF
ncbi:MAG TPA: ferrochelatase [Gammaproteobacteria bacterium]|jgi:ferrochelatase|nr:ferrochelatase [Gammaproteobacteria bacterium]